MILPSTETTTEPLWYHLKSVIIWFMQQSSVCMVPFADFTVRSAILDTEDELKLVSPVGGITNHHS